MGVLILAEAGVNHNGSLARAKEMIRRAKEAGCDCIKFQTFHTEALLTRDAPKARYQIEQTGGEQSQFEMLKALELSEADFTELKACCQQTGIEFLSTPFDAESARFLHELGLSVWKLPSGEITNKPLLEQIGSYGGKVILSTGMADLEEIRDALDWLRPTEEICLLHCTSNYPTTLEDVNMRAMLTLRDTFGLPVGYSDHTQGIEIPLMAAAMGAQVIEKHFTLDRSLPGPDHQASLEPEELARMVEGIRKIERAFGDGKKRPVPSELQTRIAARKSVVLARDVPEGVPLKREDLAVKRPGNGIPPARLELLIGRKLKAGRQEGTLLSEADFMDV